MRRLSTLRGSLVGRLIGVLFCVSLATSSFRGLVVLLCRSGMLGRQLRFPRPLLERNPLMRMLLLACVGLVLLGCADSSQPAAKVDTQTLDGKWRIVTLIDNGQVVPPATVKQT